MTGEEIGRRVNGETERCKIAPFPLVSVRFPYRAD
jgi:hypothetical protein